MTDNKSGEILIIEDDKDINDLLATALSKAGYRTRQAWSGTEGELLLRLDMEAYALVLLDLMLPGLSGEELLARIRQMDASLPVIILTAKDELDEKINLLVAGADDYITKPFEIKEVVARVAVQLSCVMRWQMCLQSRARQGKIRQKQKMIPDREILQIHT